MNTVAEDIAKLDRIEADAREYFKDPRITLADVAAIRSAARQFGVTWQASYLRAKGLRLLSYQQSALPQGSDHDK